MINTHNRYYVKFILLHLLHNFLFIFIMVIENYIRYRNPLGEFVEDFVSEHQLSKLISLGIVKPYIYRLSGNFWYGYMPSTFRLVFTYDVY